MANIYYIRNGLPEWASIRSGDIYESANDYGVFVKNICVVLSVGKNDCRVEEPDWVDTSNRRYVFETKEDAIKGMRRLLEEELARRGNVKEEVDGVKRLIKQFEERRYGGARVHSG